MSAHDEFDLLEKSIRLLQIEWEKFFSGIEKKPPSEMKTRVENLVRKYAYIEIRNNTERFRYQGLASRYNTFNELWGKRLRAMEEGRKVGFHGAHAAVAAPALERTAAPAGPAAPEAREAKEYRFRDPESDGESVRALYGQFIEARQQAGDSSPVKFESFEKLIVQQATRIIVEKGADAVDFRLETKDGKVSLKAKPVR